MIIIIKFSYSLGTKRHYIYIYNMEPGKSKLKPIDHNNNYFILMANRIKINYDINVIILIVCVIKLTFSSDVNTLI